jgi:copper transport protein
LFFRKFVLGLMLLFFAAAPGQASAHAFLVKASPAADSTWQTSPSEVRLTFNERLEKQLYAVEVISPSGNSVTSAHAIISTDQKELSLPLPKLDDGYYTVTYRVISADGHPVSGAYVFTAGQPAAGSSPFADPLLSANPHSGHGSHGQIEFWAVRIFYYAMLLFLSGWTLWSVVFRGERAEIRGLHRYWSRHLLWFYLIAAAGVGLLQVSDIFSDIHWADVMTLLTKTAVGVSWSLSILLALAGLLFLQRFRSFDAIWAVLLLAVKSISGHAMAFDTPVRTVLLDFLHLVAAAIWAGGLFYLIVVGYKHPDARSRFLPVFSRAAMWSIIVLVVTGALSLLFFIPKPAYLLYTSWGIWLLAKMFLVLCVIVTGVLLRRGMRKRPEATPLRLLRLDFALMLLITGIVGIFTFLNPFPANEPLHWHVMGEKIHMTAEISPNAPGTNDFSVQVWLPESSAAPKRVQLLLTSLDKEGRGPIEVPIAEGSAVSKQPDLFTGFHRYDYSASGPYLSFPGRWKVQVRVLDAEDNETAYEKEMRLY